MKTGAKEAVAEWLETRRGREAIEAGARSAVVDWIELTGQGNGAVSWGAKRAVADWVDGNEPAFLKALAEAVVRLGKY